MHTKLAKWIRWLEVIKEEIQQLVIAKHIFWATQEMIKNNPKIQKASDFYNFLGNTYVSYAVMGVRRQVKIDSQSISFARLLREISQAPATLSRGYYTSLYKGSNVENWADRDFDRHCGKGAAHISPTAVAAELSDLQASARSCEELADRRIAHRDKRPPSILPNFKELDRSIDKLDKLYVRYHLLFHAQAMGTLMPTFQHDWREIFREPWIAKRDE